MGRKKIKIQPIKDDRNRQVKLKKNIIRNTAVTKNKSRSLFLNASMV